MRMRSGCEGGGKGPLIQVEKSGTLATSNDQCLFHPLSVGIDGYNGTLTGGVAATLGVNCGMSTGRNGILQANTKLEILNDQGGSSMSVEGSKISPTLRCQTHGHLPVVALGFDLQQITSKVNRSTLKPIQPTLCGAGNPHVICAGNGIARKNSEIVKAYVIGSYHSKGMMSDNPLCGFYEADTARTLDLNGGNPCCNQGGIAVVQSDADWDDWELIVRRLTPLECERLQGFPDGWTEYRIDGTAISDTNRYQMLGNSVAVPCVAYIMQGIVDVIETR